jgi:hypothetical protein
MLLPLGLVLSNAWFQVLTSKLARTEDPLTMHLYTGWVGTLLASLALPFVWTPVPSRGNVGLLCFMGLMGTVGHFMLILAYRARRPPRSRPTCMRRSASRCWAAGSRSTHVPDGWSLLGMVMIAVCGAAGAWLTVRERRAPARRLIAPENSHGPVLRSPPRQPAAAPAEAGRGAAGARRRLLAVPTDSSYALACHLDDKAAADRLRQVRGVDEKHHLTLLCRDLSELANYARVDNRSTGCSSSPRRARSPSSSKPPARCRAA